MHFKALFTAFAAVTLFLSSGLDQMATLIGLVQDSSGATVSRASVELTNPATGQARVITTGADGSYLFPTLPPTAYRLRVTADGFNATTVTCIELQVEQVGRQNITLTVASVSQEVTIAGGIPLLQTEEASTGQAIETKQVVDLPLNGRGREGPCMMRPEV